MQQQTLLDTQAKTQLMVDLMNQLGKTPNIVTQFDFGKKGYLNIQDFVSICKLCSKQPTTIVLEIYRELQTKFRQVDETSIRGLHQRYTSKTTQTQQGRNPQEVLQFLNKALRCRDITIRDIFDSHDQDHDGFWTQNELKDFISYYVINITSQEFDDLVVELNKFKLNPFKITQYQMMSALQEGSSMLNSRKLDNQTKIQHNDSPKLDEPVQQFKARPQPKPQPKPVIFQVPVPQQKPKINPILESNIYEDPNQAHIMSSNIDFQEYVVLDYATAGIKEFLGDFVKLRQGNRLYTDTQFPAGPKALGYQLQNKNCEWKRPTEFWKGQNFGIFAKSIDTSRNGIGKWIDPHDIRQGELGDCYFLSAVSSVACRWPNLIQSLFVTQKINPCGMYCVRLCIDGCWKAITVDDLFPVRNNKPVFSQSSSNEIWVMLLEKAWAKVYGGYSNIQAGNPREVIRSLTGCPTVLLQTSDEKFESLFEGYIFRKCVLTSGSMNVGEKGMHRSTEDKMGLVPGHAYSILKIRYVEHPQRGKVKLIKLRNPWAEKEWRLIYESILRGDWSDDSTLWTQELRQQCKVKSKNDGAFYMEINDFRRYFGDVEVGIFNQAFKYEQLNLASNRKHALYLMFDIKGNQEGEYYFSAVQQCERLFCNKYKNYDYSPVRMLLAKQQVGNDSYEYIASSNKVDKEVWVGDLLGQGRYILYVKVLWKFFDDFDFVLSSYGEQSIKLRQVNKIKNLLNSVFAKKGASNEQRKTYQGDNSIFRTSNFKIEDGFGYFYFQNGSNTKALETTLGLRQMDGLKYRKPDRNNIVKMYLAPGQSYCAVMTIQPNGFNMALEESYVLRNVK